MSMKTLLLRTILRKHTGQNFIPVVLGNHHKQHEYNKNNKKYIKYTGAALLSSVLIGSAITDKLDSKKNDSERKPDDSKFEAGEKEPNLPTYTAEEVSKHDSVESFWVIYKNGVYDVTQFLQSHPGGEQIYNAAGLSIEPFWNVYGMHKTPDVYRLLETFRIGNLHEDDIIEHSDAELWAKEPRRDKRLLVKSARPFNAETPPRLQVEHFDTPNELFYVRQHMPVPELKADAHKLTITVKGERSVTREFSLGELERFPRVSLQAALMCAGNRRSEMDKVKPVKGLSWTTGAIGNATWSGVYLVDVLAEFSLQMKDLDNKHVVFTGADIDATGERFSTSIPLHMALNPHSRVMLATHMNGAPLPPDHGAPLRVIVPGAPAVRSVKWLESITISEEESSSHWHQKDYRGFNPSVSWETADFASAPPVYSLPVTSAICDPLDDDAVQVNDGFITVRGYAYSGGGAGILRVDVTSDRGAVWHAAHATHATHAAHAAHSPSDVITPTLTTPHYAWTLWTINLPVAERQTQMEIWVKATDTNFNTQPESFDHIWNIRGILSNAYHKINVKLKH